MGTSLTTVGSLSLNVSRESEQEWVRGRCRGHSSPSTRASTELVTSYSLRSGKNTSSAVIHLKLRWRECMTMQLFFCLHSRLAQLRGVDIPLFMISSVPSSPGPCIDTSIFSMRGYRAVCLACSRENTALRWQSISAAGGRMDVAAEAKPDGKKNTESRRWNKWKIKNPSKIPKLHTKCLLCFSL